MKKNKWEIRFDADKIDGQMMIIYIDIFGNKKREVKKFKDLKNELAKSRNPDRVIITRQESKYLNFRERFDSTQTKETARCDHRILPYYFQISIKWA